MLQEPHHRQCRRRLTAWFLCCEHSPTACVLQDNRVDNITELGTPIFNTQCDTVLYMCRPVLGLMKVIASQVRAFNARGARKNLVLCFVPRRTFICEEVLKDENVFGDLDIREYGMDIVPLDHDLLTLGLDTCYKDAYVHGDTSSLYYVTRALQKLQATYGPFANIRAKGVLAHGVVDMLQRLQREAEGVVAGSRATAATAAGGDGVASAGAAAAGGGGDAGSASAGPNAASAGAAAEAGAAAAGGNRPGAAAVRSEIDTCIILDRGIDLVSALVTPLTWESLVDELMGIEDGMAKLDAGLVRDDTDESSSGAAGGKATPARRAPQPAPGTIVSLHLNSNEKLVVDVRNTNIAAVGPRLTSRAKEMMALEDTILQRRGDLEVKDIKRFMKQIPGLQADKRTLRQLVNITTELRKETDSSAFVERWQLERSIIDEDAQSEVADALTAMIAKRPPLPNILRALCMESVVEGGFKPKQLEHFQRELIATYGFETIFTLHNLAKAGLLDSRESSGMSLGRFAVGSSSTWSQLKKALNLVAVSSPRPSIGWLPASRPSFLRVARSRVP